MTRLSPLSLRRFGGTPFSITAASMAASPRRARSKTSCASSSNSGSICGFAGGEGSAWSVNGISFQSGASCAPGTSPSIHILRRACPRSGALQIAEQLDQQAEDADKNSKTRAQQHERENKNQGRLEAAGSRHDDGSGEGRAVRDVPDAVRRRAFSTSSLNTFA